MSALGTLDELPKTYLDGLTAHNLVPLWPSLRKALPHDKPFRRTQPVVWHYADVRERLLQAGELTPIEKAERRVLVLANPGLGLENMQATPSIYIGLQLILPRETAPNHRHTPSAVRFVVEGEGGFTIVDGEKLPMQRGDLILTPPLMWHEHRHEGSGPVIWLDALDLPTVFAQEASYALEGPPQTVRNQPDSSQTHYRRAGLLPYRALNGPRANYPLLRYPWTEVRAALEAMAAVSEKGEMVHLAYVNPQTGAECLPVLGFSAIMLRPGETARPQRRSSSAVLHVVEGAVEVSVDGTTLRGDVADTMAVPTHARVAIANRSASKPAFLFQVDDAPMQRKLGFFEAFN
ncbi:MAG TPA: cupin domain-containing protein [Pseudolabrys sp.]|nr:cupin domain-containing protein [Pseudolabrys sp.]